MNPDTFEKITGIIAALIMAAILLSLIPQQ
jgi:hypothetical protein